MNYHYHLPILLFGVAHCSTHCKEKVVLTYTLTSKKRCQREWLMAVVEQRLHKWKELWFPHLVCKLHKTDNAVRTAKWLQLNIIVHQKIKKYSIPLSSHKCRGKMKPMPLNAEEYVLCKRLQNYQQTLAWVAIILLKSKINSKHWFA